MQFLSCELMKTVIIINIIIIITIIVIVTDNACYKSYISDIALGASSFQFCKIVVQANQFGLYYFAKRNETKRNETKRNQVR